MPLPDGSDQGPYLRSIRFTRYDDVRGPAIAVSIETAIKRNGRWLRNGNASSARP